MPLCDNPEADQYIDCIGVDELHHMCKPDAKETYCGIKIKTKKPGKNDSNRYGCYECTF
jgi:hypothetical protein